MSADAVGECEADVDGGAGWLVGRDVGSGFGVGFATVSGAGFGAGFGAGLAAAGLPLILKAASGASRWCLTEASTARRARPGETGFSKKR